MDMINLKINKNAKVLLVTIIGNIILSFGVVAFILPHGFIIGGATGMALASSHYLNIDLTITIWFVNIGLFLIGLCFIGKDFALKTLLSTLLYPIFLDIAKSLPILQNITNDRLMCTIYAGLCLGIGSGMIIKVGASTGGSDIISLALSKHLHLPVAKVIYVVDTIILLSQCTFSSFEQILYGILIILVNTVAINYVMTFGRSKIKLLIISEKYEEIKDMIMNELDLGATLLNIENPYKGKPSKAVLVICSNRSLYKINERIDEIDPLAFVTISNTSEVRGRGFTIARDE